MEKISVRIAIPQELYDRMAKLEGGLEGAALKAFEDKLRELEGLKTA